MQYPKTQLLLLIFVLCEEWAMENNEQPNTFFTIPAIANDTFWALHVNSNLRISGDWISCIVVTQIFHASGHGVE